MASITSSGIGSGLDVRNLVDKLVTAEGAPQAARLDREEAKLETGISAVGTFKSALSEFQSSFRSLRREADLQAMTASSDDETVLSVSASRDAEANSYDIEVKALASAHRLTSTGFASDFDSLGAGTLKIQFGTYDNENNKFELNNKRTIQTITFTEEQSALHDIQNRINDANIGVRASIINDGEGSRLVLTAQAPGAENSMRIRVEDNDGSDTNLYGLSLLSFDPESEEGAGRNMLETAEASDAKINIDGIDAQSATNDVAEVVHGVSFSLHEVGHAEAEVKFDQSKITEKIRAFVGGYNAFQDMVTELTGYDQATGVAGPLSGDPLVRSAMEQIRRQISSSFDHLNEDYPSLMSIGITTERNGHLSINERKLTRALDDNLQEVVNMFAKAGTTTDPRLRFLEATEQTASGAFDVVIDQKPTKGGYAGLRMDPFPMRINDTSDQFALMVDGVRTNPIELEHKTYLSGYELAKDMQSQINNDAKMKENDLKVRVSYFDRRLIIISERFGNGSTVEVVAADHNVTDELGLAIGPGERGKDVQGTIGGYRTLGSGQTMLGQQDISGLKLDVLGGEEGRRGKVIYSHGLAVKLDELVDGYIGTEGVVKSRADGFSSRLENIGDQREKLARKLEQSEQRYLKQFTDLDALIGKMNSTSEFLTNQLKALPGARSKPS